MKRWRSFQCHAAKETLNYKRAVFLPFLFFKGSVKHSYYP